jgi:hypothetical protein
MAAMRERASPRRALPVLDRRGRHIGSVRRIGSEHLELRREARPSLRVPIAAVRRLDREGVHVDAVISEVPGGPLESEGPAIEDAPVLAQGRGRSAG